jgi:hypothetical protein
VGSPRTNFRFSGSALSTQRTTLAGSGTASSLSSSCLRVCALSFTPALGVAHRHKTSVRPTRSTHRTHPKPPRAISGEKLLAETKRAPTSKKQKPLSDLISTVSFSSSSVQHNVA